MRYLRALRSTALGLLCLTVVACRSNGGTEGASGNGLQAAVVPGADFLMRIDYRAMTQSQVLEKLKATETTSTPTDRWAKFLETTGLGAESLEGLLVSMDLDSIDPSSDGSRNQQMEAAIAVLAVSLDTPLTHEDIVAGVVSANAEGKANASIVDHAGARMVRIEVQEETETRVVYGAPSSRGDTVYFSMNATSIQGALDREASGVPTSIPPALEAAETSLSPEAQVRMAFLAPPSWRAKIGEQVDDPSGGMASGMLSPLKDLQSIALGMAFDVELQVQLVGDLGNENAAQQASAFLQMMVVPMLQSAMAENGADADADRLEVGVEGNVLQMGLSLSEADITAFRDKASSMSDAGMGGSAH